MHNFCLIVLSLVWSNYFWLDQINIGLIEPDSHEAGVIKKKFVYIPKVKCLSLGITWRSIYLLFHQTTFGLIKLLLVPSYYLQTTFDLVKKFFMTDQTIVVWSNFYWFYRTNFLLGKFQGQYFYLDKTCIHTRYVL